MQAPKVTMKQVAGESGVTVGTVSAILRGSRDRIFYSDETRDRVLAVVERLGYRVNPTARSLREGKTRTIGVMLDDITLPFLASLIRATGTALEAHGYSIMLCNLDAASAARESLLQVFARGHIDSFMLAGALTRLSDEDLLDIHRRGHRIVLLERAAPDPAIASVGVDNAAGGRLAANHLKDPEYVTLSSDQVGALQISHFVYLVREGDKRGDILRHEPRDRSPIRFLTSSLALCLFRQSGWHSVASVGYCGY
jgi:LacI family transcriptional regulator